MMNVMMWYPPAPVAPSHQVDEKVPWFLRSDYSNSSSIMKKPIVGASPMDDRELLCAEVLLSLKALNGSIIPKATPPPALLNATRGHASHPYGTKSQVTKSQTALHQTIEHNLPIAPVQQISAPSSPSSPSSSFEKIPLIKSDLKQQKKKIKRNTNPCTEHRRKHQRCPPGCIGRKKDIALLKQQQIQQQQQLPQITATGDESSQPMEIVDTQKAVEASL
jgi:hypothetical protein